MPISSKKEAKGRPDANSQSLSTLLDRFQRGEQLAAARVVSLVENEAPDAQNLLRVLYPLSGRAYKIGVTGPPGAGKSTLVDKLALMLVERGNRVGIIAVDPTSPFTGGALLGDRIRMQDLGTIEGVFIRSMATRGSLGGLARATKEVSVVLDAFGMDFVIIETVGVGQIELDIADATDTTLVMLVPESGDGIQAMKAGLMEIADILVINKADHQGADRLWVEVDSILRLKRRDDGWIYPVAKTVAIHKEGVQELLSLIDGHGEYLRTRGLLERHREEQLRKKVREIVEARIVSFVERRVEGSSGFQETISHVVAGETDPYQAADELLQRAGITL